MRATSRQCRRTAIATRQFFETLEEHFGGNLPIDQGRAAEVIVRDTLEASDLQRLFQHQATAIHIPNYFPRASAIELGSQLARQVQEGKAKNWKVSTAQGLESSDVFTLGAHVPYNVAVAGGETDQYHLNVQKELRQRRRDEASNTAKTLWPLDQLRLELDQAWPQGAGLSRDSKNPQNYKGGGLPRIMLGPTRWKKGFVHVDEMAPLSPESGFFSGNIYLQLPDTTKTEIPQPVLEIWPLGIHNKWDWYKVRNSFHLMF